MSARDDYPLHRALEMLNDCPSALDEIDRLRRSLRVLHECNAWRENWMSRASAEMHTVLDAREQDEPIPGSSVACMEALIAEWWGDGEEDDDA